MGTLHWNLHYLLYAWYTDVYNKPNRRVHIYTSYWPSSRSVRQVMDRVFSFLLWPKREARGPWKQGRKKRGSITCRTDRANEAIKMFVHCLLYGFVDNSGKGTNLFEVLTDDWELGPYGHLRTWSWPIITLDISQPYNNTSCCILWDPVKPVFE